MATLTGGKQLRSSNYKLPTSCRARARVHAQAQDQSKHDVWCYAGALVLLAWACLLAVVMVEPVHTHDPLALLSPYAGTDFRSPRGLARCTQPCYVPHSLHG